MNKSTYTNGRKAEAEERARAEQQREQGTARARPGRASKAESKAAASLARTGFIAEEQEEAHP